MYIEESNIYGAIQYLQRVFENYDFCLENPKKIKAIKDKIPSIVTSYLSQKSENLKKRLDIVLRLLISAKMQEFIFSTLASEFGTSEFWSVFETLVLEGRLKRVPVEPLLLGQGYLDGETISLLVLELEKDAFNKIGQKNTHLMNVLVAAKQWAAMYKLAFSFPSQLMEIMLIVLKSKADSLSKKDSEDIYIKTVNRKMKIEEIDPKLETKESHFLWIFWIMWRVVSYNQIDSFFGVEYTMEIFEVTVNWMCKK